MLVKCMLGTLHAWDTSFICLGHSMLQTFHFSCLSSFMLETFDLYAWENSGPRFYPRVKFRPHFKSQFHDFDRWRGTRNQRTLLQTRRSQTEHLVRTATVSSAVHFLLRKSTEQFRASDLAARPYSVQWVSLSGSPRVMPCGASKRDTGAER